MHTVISIGYRSDSEIRLKLTSNYCSTCQGNYTLTYECEVMGGQFDSTLWSGSAFDCAKKSNEITLLHHLYVDNSTEARAKGVCNNGSIVAQIVRVENNIYVSQLNVTVSDSVIGQGKTIECNYVNATTTMRVGEETLHVEGSYIDSFCFSVL
jgi:hypothetical protein